MNPFQVEESDSFTESLIDTSDEEEEMPEDLSISERVGRINYKVHKSENLIFSLLRTNEKLASELKEVKNELN